MNRIVAAALVAGGMFAASVSVASAATVVSTVAGFAIDGCGYGDGSPFKNGTATCGATSSIQLWNYDGSESRGIIEFDISEINYPIDSATLRLTRSISGAPHPLTIAVKGYSGDGLFDLQDFQLGTEISQFGFFNEYITEIDVTDLIKGLLSTGNEYAGFTLSVIGIIETGGAFFMPNGTLQQFNFPELVVAPVPLPAAAWLLLSALGGLGLAGWRRKRLAAV